MKELSGREVLLGVVILVLATSQFSTCVGRAAERKVHQQEYNDYRSDLSAMSDTIQQLTEDSARLATAYHAARQRVRVSIDTVRIAIERGDTLLGLAAVGHIMAAGEACHESYLACEQRAAVALRLAARADSAAEAGHEWALQEIRLSRQWHPFSLKPPSLVWVGILLVAGMSLR